ncbi:DUF305 domain-containing protein [Kineosporia rhizophila]|uniref:DUF305 domain-containing protein n=1 Tax=Kineosporia rhizophila TaxID=84633 RepID=UPI002FCD87C4
MSRLRAVTLTGLSLATGAVLFLGGCGALNGLSVSGSSDAATAEVAAAESTHGAHGTGTQSAAAGHNDADVMFLQMMVARQVETAKLTDLATEGRLTKQAAALVSAIGITETDEQAQMSGWLKAWGEPAEMADEADLHAEHGGVSRLTESDVKSLKSASAGQFQTQYLNLLIAQQSNAVEIARYVGEKGSNPEVLELATRIETSRSAQVKQMLGLLAETPA